LTLYKLLTLGTILSGAMTMGGLAFAQTDQDDEIVTYGRYLYTDQVNALKTPTPIIDVPQSLSITTAEQIVRQGFNSIEDIVLYTPGVTASQGEGHRDAVVFRGVRSTADFFIDGVRDDVQYYRSLYNLEQVEILRGPNALLFGRGGTGGLLNRVTKKAAIGEQFTGYKGSLDTFGGFDVAVDQNFTLTDNAALRFNGYYESLNNHRDFFDGDRFGFNPTARFELTPATTIDLSYEYIDNERFIDRGIPSGADGRPAEQLEDITFADPENNFTTLQAHVFRANLQHQFNDNLKGNFSAFYGDYDKVYSNLFPNSFDEVTNIVELDGYIDTTQRETFQLSGNLIGNFATGGIGHTIVAGAEFIDTVNNNDRFNTFFSTSAADRAAEIAANGTSSIRTDRARFIATRPIDFSGNSGRIADGRFVVNTFGDLNAPNADLANSSIINDDTEADVQVVSAYIQDEIAVTDYLDIIVGGRFDRFEIDVLNLVNGEQRSRTDEEFSPRLGVILKPQENISLYGSYSESFLPRSGEQFANINGANDVLEPDSFRNLEAGLKWDFTDRFSFTGAVFEIQERSPQIDDNDAGAFVIIESEIQGFEAQILGQITDRWDITAGYSYLDGDQVSNSGATQGQNNGLRLRELPESTFNLWSNYQVTDQFGLGGGLTHQGEQFADNGNNVTLPSFTRFDAAAYYDVNEDLRVQVNVENLFDTDYFPTAHTANNITVGAPLNARFTISGRF